MERDELRAVGERRLHLHLGDQRSDAVQHVVGGEHVAAGLHQVGDAAAVAGRLEHPVGEHRDRLGMVEAQAACATARVRGLGGDVDEQALLFVRGEAHRGT